MVKSTKPPTRIEVSVPGIRNDRGKLPAVVPVPGGGGWVPNGIVPPPPALPGSGGACATACASWSIRCWSSC